jgi:hypothetical protein
MHAMQPLGHGLGLCHVRTQVALDEPPAPLPGELPRLTESVLGYLQVVSRQTPVVYVAIDGDEQAAGGWREGRLALGPLRTNGPNPPRGLLRRREPCAVESALEWLGVRRPRGGDRLRALGLDTPREWEPR